VRRRLAKEVQNNSWEITKNAKGAKILHGVFYVLNSFRVLRVTRIDKSALS